MLANVLLLQLFQHDPNGHFITNFEIALAPVALGTNEPPSAAILGVVKDDTLRWEVLLSFGQVYLLRDIATLREIGALESKAGIATLHL